ncbi:hypothetical protein [Actinomadura atramentaria]|uniref:hypothetical protein n=1 Tax=Actinomadura atramentaria TaxID=1990 RepID=UPI0003747FE8|nr:hypothetical protein [Actinomadura atramentaria]
MRSALAALLAVPSLLAVAAPATADTTPTFDLRADCPALPAGAEPAAWECLEMVVAGGSMTLGGITQQISAPLRLVVQAGPPAGGGPNEVKQVRMDPAPMKVPGGVFGLLGIPTFPGLDDVPGVRVAIEPHYAGGFSFALPTATMDLRVRIDNLFLGDSCYLGGEKDPLRFSMIADMSTLRIVSPGDPADPLGSPTVLSATASDETFSVPASDCGLLGPVIDWAAGLPSPSGKNTATFNTFIALGSYGGAAVNARTTTIH